MNEKDLLEEIGKVSEELIAAHALPDAKRFGESGAEQSDTAKEQIVMKQQKNEYIRNPFVRALPVIAAAAAVIVAGVIILPKTNLMQTPGTSVATGKENGYRLELDSAELKLITLEGEKYVSLCINAKLVYPQLDAPTTVWYGDFRLKKGDMELYCTELSTEPTGEVTAEGEILTKKSYELLTSGTIPVDAENTPLPLFFAADGISTEMLENGTGDLILSAEFNIGAADPAEADQVILLDVPVTYQITKESASVVTQDMTGWDFELAEETLLASHLFVDKRVAYDPDIPEGCVISTDPQGSATLAPGSFVRVVVSLGPAPGQGKETAIIPCPDFIGFNWETAKAIADGMMLVLAKNEVESDEAAGTIISQDIAPREEIAEETIITVTVSKGLPDSAELEEVEIPVAVPENANGRFYFTVYSLFDLGEDPAPIKTSKVFEAGEGLPEIGTAKVTFSSENNVDAGVMLYNAETGEKAQIAAFYYIRGTGFQELPGRTNPELMSAEEAFRKTGLLK